jgi:hypothetical protein
MSKKKPIIIPVSFKTETLDDKLLLDWMEEKFLWYGKSQFIKSVLRKEMMQEIQSKETS